MVKKKIRKNYNNENWKIINQNCVWLINTNMKLEDNFIDPEQRKVLAMDADMDNICSYLK